MRGDGRREDVDGPRQNEKSPGIGRSDTGAEWLEGYASESTRRARSERLVAGPFRVTAIGAGDHLVVRSEVFHGLDAPVNGVVIVFVSFLALAVAVDVHPLVAQVPATRPRTG